MKVVINQCFGGFSLSEEAIDLYLTRKGIDFWKEHGRYSSLTGPSYYRCPPEHYLQLQAEARNKNASPDRYREINELYISTHDVERWDPVLVQIVEELGEASWGSCARLGIVDIPFEDGEGWHIDEYDGNETIHEDHRTWG